MLAETTSHHIDASEIMTDEFIEEVFKEIKGVRKPPAAKKALYQPF